MNKSEIKAFLKSMFPQLESSTLDEFVDCCDYKKLAKGTELIQEGKRHQFFYLISKGSVKSYYLKQGKEICTWFAFEKEMISTIKSFNGLPSNETIKLLEDSELIRINIEAFKTLAKTKITVSHLLIDLISEYAVF